MSFGAGDSILFSLTENTIHHGGEIWVWHHGGPAGFLVHGGVTWDTANQPSLLFGWVDPAGPPANDINALEAIFVPEPASGVMALLALALSRTSQSATFRLNAQCPWASRRPSNRNRQSKTSDRWYPSTSGVTGSNAVSPRRWI